jgi:DNA-binding transcriptional LysR family regulator
VAQLRPALDGVHAAFAALAEGRGRPSGTLRLSVLRLAMTWVLEPMLAEFLRTYPELRLDITVEDAFVRIAERRYDGALSAR